MEHFSLSFLRIICSGKLSHRTDNGWGAKQARHNSYTVASDHVTPSSVVKTEMEAEASNKHNTYLEKYPLKRLSSYIYSKGPELSLHIACTKSNLYSRSLQVSR